jgi:hypothetical protein
MIEYGPRRDGTFRLRLTFRGDTRLFVPGEHFTIDWRADATGSELMKVGQTVQQYDESYPGGRDCTPVACRTKAFAL